MKIKILIKEERLKKRLTQKELSRLCGISQSHISDVENGVKSPTIRTIEKIANSLKINPLDLLKVS